MQFFPLFHARQTWITTMDSFLPAHDALKYEIPRCNNRVPPVESDKQIKISHILSHLPCLQLTKQKNSSLAPEVHPGNNFAVF